MAAITPLKKIANQNNNVLSHHTWLFSERIEAVCAKAGRKIQSQTTKWKHI